MKVLIISLLFRLCSAYFQAPNVISNVEESFVYKGRREFLMLNIPVTWDEGLIICQAYENGSMAVVNTKEIAVFLADALFETNLEMEDLWVGARIPANQTYFEWINNRGIFDPKLDNLTIARGPENFTPNITRECLAFARSNHILPSFVSLECILQRPVMCEKPYRKIVNGSMTTPDWIRVGMVKYGIFYDRKTWSQSVRECRRKHSAHLASFRTSREVKIVGKFELVGRPSLENAWIGGFYKGNGWRFLYNMKTIPDVTNETTGFPPWRGNESLRRSGCLLLDRHLSDEPVFLEARCERERSYICTKIVNDIPDYQIFVNDERTAYVLYFLKKTWDEAWDTCKALGGHNCHLVKVTKQNIHDMMYMMGENFTVINHVWIGGRLSLDENKFFWVFDSSVIFPNNVNIKRYPPWFDNKYEDSFACLNLDRENHNRPMFYGADCDTPQSFICETKDIHLLPEPTEDWLVNLTTDGLLRYGSYYIDDLQNMNESELALKMSNNVVVFTSNMSDTVVSRSNKLDTVVSTSNMSDTVVSTSNKLDTVASISNKSDTVVSTSNMSDTVVPTSNMSPL